MRIGGSDDLDAVAVGQFGDQRHRLEIDVGGNAVVADVRVHRVCQVDRRRSARQGDDLALRREDVDLVRKEVHLDVLEEIARLVARTLQIEQRVKPGGSLLLQFGAEVLAVLVQPVRRDAFLCQVVHRLGANLQLEGRSVRSDQRRVQGLVTVRLRDGDVVLELPRHRFVEAVQHPERDIAGRLVGDQHTKAVDVEHLRKRESFLEHLAVDRVQALLAAEGARVDTRVVQPAVDAVENARQDFAPVAACRLQCTRKNPGAHREDELEREILQLVVKLVEPQPVGDRRVDLERLAGDAAPFLRPHGSHGLQIVVAIGEFDQDHAQVARHRHQHLAEVLCLRFLGRLELELVELRQAVDEIGNRLAEALGDGALADRRVLHHVVQQGGDHPFDVHLPFGNLAGNGQRVGDVGLARLSHLAPMRRLAEAIGLADEFDLFRRQVHQAVDEHLVGWIVLRRRHRLGGVRSGVLRLRRRASGRRCRRHRRRVAHGNLPIAGHSRRINRAIRHLLQRNRWRLRPVATIRPDRVAGNGRCRRQRRV